MAWHWLSHCSMIENIYCKIICMYLFHFFQLLWMIYPKLLLVYICLEYISAWFIPTQRDSAFWAILAKNSAFGAISVKTQRLTFWLKTQRFEQFPSKPSRQKITRHGISMKHYPKPSFLSRALLFGRNNSAFGTIFQWLSFSSFSEWYKPWCND